MPVYLGSLLPGDAVVDSAQRRLIDERQINPAAAVTGGGDNTTSPVTVGTASAGGGGGGAGGMGLPTAPLGAATPRWSTWAPATPSQSVADAVKARQAKLPDLGKDPQLPQAPGGSYTDSQYQAENATLEQQVNAAYADILQQTGFDVGGVHTPGSVEMKAGRQERDYLTGLVNAANDVTAQMQQAGTVFSGYHAQQRAKSDQPYITGLGDLNVDTPNTLSGLTEQASDLMRQFVAQRNSLLAAAAWRQEQRLLASKAQAGVGDGTENAMPGGGDEALAGAQLSGGTGYTPGGQEATYLDNPVYGPGAQPAPWAPGGTTRPAPATPSSANSPYYYGGGGKKPKKPVRSPYYYGGGG